MKRALLNDDSNMKGLLVLLKPSWMRPWPKILLTDDYLPKSELYSAYIRFCKKYKLPVKSHVGFGKEIARLRISNK